MGVSNEIPFFKFQKFRYILKNNCKVINQNLYFKFIKIFLYRHNQDFTFAKIYEIKKEFICGF